MCGIAGKLLFSQKLNKKTEVPVIEKIREVLKHRGPDHQGYKIYQNGWFLADRLSIIDITSAANQPVISEDGKICLVFNGEIYNFRELKSIYLKKYSFKSDSDAEVLLRLYQEKDTGCLSYLRGMFAFAIWDERKKRLFLARDRIGKKPIKYYFDNNCFIFASELKAILSLPEVKKEPDWQAIGGYLKSGYVRSPLTGFKGIYKLPPASYMTVTDSGKIRTESYWKLDFNSKLDLPEENWQQLLENKLRESVRIRLKSDVPLGVHLSGGIDSSIITALASEESSGNIKTFTVGFDEKDYDEMQYARKITALYKTEHSEIKVQPNIEEIWPKMMYQFEEPFADPSMIPTWYLMSATKGHVKVVLNGDGGDENFAGYPRYQLMKYANFLQKLPYPLVISRLLRNLYSLGKIKDFDRLAKYLPLLKLNDNRLYEEITSILNTRDRKVLLTASLIKKIKAENDISGQLEILLNGRYRDDAEKFILQDIHFYLPDNLMAKTDLASMAFSLETRSPFLDHEFMELTAKMPSGLKLKGFQTKYILKKMALKYLPGKTVYRRKKGFLPPIEHWLRRDLGNYLKSELFSRNFLNLDLVNPLELERYLKEHQAGLADHSYILWLIFCLRGWFKVWYNT